MSKLFSKLALILSKSKFSGNITFLAKLHQKHSVFLTTISSEYISGFGLYHLIVNIALSIDKSISSNSIQAIGASIINSYGVSNISTATCHTFSSSSLIIFFSSSYSQPSSSFVTQNNLNILLIKKNINNYFYYNFF